MNQALKQAEERFLAMFSEIAVIFRATGFEIDDSEVLSFRALQEFSDRLETGKRNSEYYRAKSAQAGYLKLRHAFNLMISESYGSFLKFVDKLKRDKSKAARRILSSDDFHQLVELAKRESGRHPKVNRLMGVASGLASKNRCGLIFVAFKNSAKYLAELIRAEGLEIETVFGGRDKDFQRQCEALDRISRKELNFIVATSVIEEGVSIPEVDAVVHYSVPETEISWLQRSGRTGRLVAGEVVFITMDHFMDQGKYWATRHQLTTMNRLAGSNLELKGKFFKNRKYRGKIDQTPLLPFLE